MTAAAVADVESSPLGVCQAGMHVSSDVLREVGDGPSADSGRFRHWRMKIYAHMGMKTI